MKKGNDTGATVSSSRSLGAGLQDLANLGKILAEFKNKRQDNYDCLFHLDGSRSNLRSLYYLRKVFGMTPLAVTFNHHNYRGYQKINIRRALEAFDIDHLMYTPRLSVINKLKEKYPDIFADVLERGIIALSVNASIKYNVPLLAWEQSTLGTKGPTGSSMISRLNGQLSDPDLFGFDIRDLIGGDITAFDLVPYNLPSEEDLKGCELNLVSLQSAAAADKREIADFLEENFRFDEDIPAEGVDRFWIGFPEEWGDRQLEVRSKDHLATKYEKLVVQSEYGRPLYDRSLRYCVRCCMPETAEELAFDELGMCQPCRSSEQKMHIDWVKREQRFKDILQRYSCADGNFYDVMVPISGGKDSTFQLYVLTQVYKKKVLAVTFSHNWYSRTGRYNLFNAINRFDVDHYMFTPRRTVVNKLARKSLYMIGDACWHCHAGVGSFPLQAAVRFGVRLLVWGESVAENDGRATYENPIVFDRDYFTKISARFYAEEMVDENISKLDVLPYILPSHDEIFENGVVGIHLGDYMFWDDERQMEFVRDNFGWKEDKVEGTYKGYKSVECLMAGIHDYTKFIKRGYGRGTDHASQDVRVGLLTREEGFELAKKHDTERPIALDYYLDITGYTEDEFERVLKTKRENKATELP